MLKPIAGVMFLAAAAWAAAPPAEAGIRQADTQWAAAVQGRDVAGLEKIFDDGLIYAHSSGIVETKKEYLDRLRGGRQRYDQVTIEKSQVALHGGTAVTLSWVRMSGQSNERLFNDHLIMTHVWVRKGGAWKLAAHQTTRLAD
jgi:ketosteroid isomerase-like protein